jgi:hypothetical protein
MMKEEAAAALQIISLEVHIPMVIQIMDPFTGRLIMNED